MKERRAIKITDIDQMIQLVDDVLIVARYDISLCDCNGVFLPDDDIERRMQQLEKDRLDGSNTIIVKILQEAYKSYHIEEAANVPAKEIVEKLEPIKKRIIGMFRNGEEDIECDCIDYVDDSVDDEWLLALFAIRIRDQMINVVNQRDTDELREKNKKKRLNK